MLQDLLKKKKKEEEDRIKNEEKKIITSSILYKKMQKIKKNKSFDQWVERLYKEDPKRRKMEKEYMEKISRPSFRPYLPRKKKSKIWIT